MLILTRKAGESIRVGDGIEIVVASIKGNKVQIGIDAAQQIKVLRGELTDWEGNQCDE